MSLGGFLNPIPSPHAFLHSAGLAFDSLRSGLVFLARQRHYSKMYLPRYLCGCVKETLAANDISVEFYSLNDDFEPNFALVPAPNEGFFFVNYFGKFSVTDIHRYHQRYPSLVLDNTQAYFQAPLPGVDTLYSCRKFFPVPDGAFLFASDAESMQEAYNALPRASSHQDVAFLFDRLENGPESAYPAFQASEERPFGLPPKRISLTSWCLLSHEDAQAAKSQRTDNYSFLDQRLRGINLLVSDNWEGHLYYPLLIPKGEEVRRLLIQHQIYVPCLWPDSEQEPSESIGYRCSHDLVPLSVDQRYGRVEMELIINTLKELNVL
jgi:hypothetical protein